MFGGGMMLTPSLLQAFEPAPSTKAQVAFVKTTDRAAGVARAIDLLGLGKQQFRGKDLFIKPNFNSADATPGSTHIDTLLALTKKLKSMGSGPITIGDRSGMGNTREVMEKKQAFQLGKELDAKIVVFDDLGADDWELLKTSDSHWQQGFALPRVVRKSGGHRPDLLPEDTPLRRPFHVVTEKLGWIRCQVGSGKFLQLHARTAFLTQPAAHDRRDQHRLSS